MDDDRDELARRFTAHMHTGVDTLARLGYNATRFRQMLAQYGGPETARRLVHAPASEGLWTLARMRRLDMSVEFWVLLPEYEPLFELPTREKAERKLRQLDFDVSKALRQREGADE